MITTSLPTFFIASAMMLPMVDSDWTTMAERVSPPYPILSRILILKLESASDLECPGASGTEHLPGAAGWLHKREALRRLHLIKS